MNLNTLAHLTILYNEPHRHYHNLNHIHQLLGEYEQYQKDTNDDVYSENIIESIWWHDAIYNPYSSKNEFNSDRLYRATNEIYHANVSNAIMATAKHTFDQTDLGYVEKLILDLDLSSLGHSYEEFAKNGDNIRKEYHFVPDTLFYEKRVEFLKAMLARKRIYYTDYFYNKYEEKARANITRAIDDALRAKKRTVERVLRKPATKQRNINKQD